MASIGPQIPAHLLKRNIPKDDDEGEGVAAGEASGDSLGVFEPTVMPSECADGDCD